jgi:hypothetical protein
MSFYSTRIFMARTTDTRRPQPAQAGGENCGDPWSPRSGSGRLCHACHAWLAVCRWQTAVAARRVDGSNNTAHKPANNTLTNTVTMPLTAAQQENLP